ncbi:hypothetical protein B0H14DRAFT_1419804 [Mycena olivaceomarginata]|nr:hypothetical protein B0H14DRAFT_1419804 [Mycena olivaceomarginata]
MGQGAELDVDDRGHSRYQFEYFVHLRRSSCCLVKPGLSWMYLAARDGQVDVVHFLLGNIPDINEADNTQKTALHHAAMNGRTSVVKLLIDNHALLELGGALSSSRALPGN